MRAARLALQLGADVRLEPEHGGLALERRHDALEALQGVGLGQELREVIALELEVGRGRIDQLVGIGDGGDLRARELAARLVFVLAVGLGRALLALGVGHDREEVVAHLLRQDGKHLRVAAAHGRQRGDTRDQERLVRDQRVDVHALEEAHHAREPTWRVLHDLHDLGAHADLVEILLARVANGRIALRDDDDQIVVAGRGFDRANRRFATDLERPDVPGQLDLGPQRNDGVLTSSLGVLGHGPRSVLYPRPAARRPAQ